MKKSIITFALTIGAALLLAGCGTTSAAAPAPAPAPAPAKPAQKAPPFTIIQHQLSVIGGEIPSWVSQDADELETQPQYKDKYVFKFDGGESKDLDGAKIVTKKIDAADQITSMVKQRIQSKFAGAQVGDKNKVETYFESVVKSLGDAKVTGFRQEKEFWVQLQYNKADGTPDPDKIVYRYFVLYSVPKSILNDQIKKAFDDSDGAAKPKTEDEVSARSRVKDAFKDGF